MNARRLASIALALAAVISGCSSAPRVSAPPLSAHTPPRSAPPSAPPAHVLDVPDAIPRAEPRALYAMAVYELAAAVKQQVLASDAQRGVLHSTAPPAATPPAPLAAGSAPPGNSP